EARAEFVCERLDRPTFDNVVLAIEALTQAILGKLPAVDVGLEPSRLENTMVLRVLLRSDTVPMEVLQLLAERYQEVLQGAQRDKLRNGIVRGTERMSGFIRSHLEA